MDQREWDYGARMPRDQRAAESFTAQGPDVPQFADPEPQWAALTDTGSLQPSPEALAWQRRADAWAQQAESDQSRTIEPTSRWSEVAATGRPTFPADGVGWRTETAEWRATGALWRQTTEWRSSSGTHGWRSTTEAWQSGGPDGIPPTTPPTAQPAISSTAWQGPPDTTTTTWQGPPDTTTWQGPADTTTWQSSPGSGTVWRSRSDAPTWQGPSDTGGQDTPMVAQPWQQPEAERPSWQQTDATAPFAQQPMEQEPTWQQSGWQQGSVPPWQQAAPAGPPTTRPPVDRSAPWQQLVEPTSAGDTRSWPGPPAEGAPGAAHRAEVQDSGSQWPAPDAHGGPPPTWQRSEAPGWQQPEAPGWRRSEAPGWQQPEVPGPASPQPAGWQPAPGEPSGWQRPAEAYPSSSQRPDTVDAPSWHASEAPGWHTPRDDGRHMVREDDRAAWRRDREVGAGGTGRRGVAGPPSGGTGWAARSDADNWAGHTDTGYFPHYRDPAAPTWGTRSEAPEHRVPRPPSYGPEPTPYGQDPTPDQPGRAPSRRTRRAAPDDWRRDADSWAAEPDTSNWVRDPDTGQWSRAEDDPRVAAWRDEAARRGDGDYPSGRLELPAAPTDRPGPREGDRSRYGDYGYPGDDRRQRYDDEWRGPANDGTATGGAFVARVDASPGDEHDAVRDPRDDPYSDGGRRPDDRGFDDDDRSWPNGGSARPPSGPGTWQQAERDAPGRGGATYRSNGSNDWRRELTDDRAHGPTPRYASTASGPRPSGSAAVPGGANLSMTSTSLLAPADGRDATAMRGQRAGYLGPTGSYERRPVTGAYPMVRKNLAAVEDDEPEASGGPLAAVGYTVIWYGVPVVLFVFYMLVINTGSQTHALTTLTRAAPQFLISLVLSMIVAVGIRWASGAWKAASVGLAAAVVGGGLATVLSSAITGNSLS